jgi:hypothetical protein
MCSAPDIPTPPPPPAEQEVKQPAIANVMDKSKRNRVGGMTGGSLLTGPAGAAPAAGSTARATLLGQ